MSLTTSAEWKSLVLRADGALTAVIRLYYGDESSYISISDGEPIVIAGETFLGVLNQIPEVEQLINIKTHEHSITDLTLEIDNLLFDPGQRFSDLLENTTYQSSAADRGFYNRKIDIRLYLPGITSFSNCFAIMSSGVIRDIKHTHSITTINVQDLSELTNVMIGDLLTGSDAASGEGRILPPESLGKIGPIQWGDRTIKAASTVPGTIAFTMENNGIPCVYRGRNNDGKHSWMVSEHKMELLGSSDDQIVGYDPVLGRDVLLRGYTVDQNTSSGCIISHDDGEDFVDYLYPNGNNSNKTEVSGGGAASVTNEDQMGDKDNDTFGRLSVTNAAGGGAPSATVSVDFPSYSNPGTIVQVVVLARVDRGGSASFNTIKINGIDVSGETGAAYNPVGTEAASEAGAEDPVSLVLIGTTGTDTDTNTLDGYMVFKKIRYIPTQRLQLYSVAQGKEYGTWINSRTQGDDTHEENNDNGGLIENYAGVIEDALRSHMGIVTANIDLATLNTASVKLPKASYSPAPQIIERMPGKTFLFDLVRDCRSYLWWQPDGTIKMQVIEDTYSSSTRTIDARDVDLEFDRTTLSDLKTAVNIQYGWNERQSRLLLSTGISEDTKFQTRYNVTQAQSLLDKETPSILDSTTATNMRLFERNFWMQQHNIAFGTLGREHLDLDIGDRLDFSNLQYNPFGETITSSYTRSENGGSSQLIYPYFWIFHIRRGRRLFFRAIQLHRLDQPA